MSTTVHSPPLFYRGRLATWDPRRKANRQTEGIRRHVVQLRSAISNTSPHLSFGGRQSSNDDLSIFHMRVERDIEYLDYGHVTVESGQIQSVFRYDVIERKPRNLIAPTSNVRGGTIAILDDFDTSLLV